MNDTYGSEFRAGIQRSMAEPFRTYTRIERARATFLCLAENGAEGISRASGSTITTR